jgi:hypothetical protein
MRPQAKAPPITQPLENIVSRVINLNRNIPTSCGTQGEMISGAYDPPPPPIADPQSLDY